MKNKQAINSLAKHAKKCYVQVLTETQMNCDSDSDEYHSSSDSDQELVRIAGCVWHRAGVNHLSNRG